MQPNFAQKNRSSIIRLTEAAKKKARRRLIGSISLLLIALLILLNVTARIKPISIKPDVIELKGALRKQQPLAVVASTPVPVIAANSITASGNAIAVKSNSSAQVLDSKSNAPLAVTAVVGNSAVKKDAIQIESIVFKARVVGDKPNVRLSPEDILGGKTANKAQRYFIQLIGLSDRTKITQIQAELNKNSVSTSLQAIQTPSGEMVYRLRIGPFTSQMSANTRLSALAKEGKLMVTLSY